ncbi:hypothetical protein OEZ86_010882 [Tetradesmus obliquus]|nr:hypothetical protein OEZ86_010882 [Tetradesmus obliquus]
MFGRFFKAGVSKNIDKCIWKIAAVVVARRQVRDDMQNASAHLLRPGTGLQLQPAVASSQLAAQGQPAAAYQAASASAHQQLSGLMERFTDAERKQLAFSVLIAGASVLSSAQVQQQGIPAAACRPEVGANRLLAWAGQILGCQLQDAYHLAVHIFKRTAGRLDDMLLISLGATLPVDSVTMLVSLWLATKLEGHRRQVAGCSKLAGALALLPWAVTAIELHMMQLMDWQPYAGWALREQERSCTVTEVY